ncbi:MAG: hypothetical protein ABEJ35_05295 [Halobacteriaceae archaeon]
MAETLLDGIRERPRRRWLTTIAGVLLGFVAATMDPLGFLLGGALVGLPARTVRRGLATGLAFGLGGAGVFLAGLGMAGSLGRVLATGLPALIAVLSPVVLGLAGSLARAVY